MLSDEEKVYKLKLEEEMQKQGADDSDFKLISDELITNAMKNNREPQDVAWAILQWKKHISDIF